MTRLAIDLGTVNAVLATPSRDGLGATVDPADWGHCFPCLLGVRVPHSKILIGNEAVGAYLTLPIPTVPPGKFQALSELETYLGQLPDSLEPWIERPVEMFLAHLVRAAEEYLGASVTKLTLTHPARYEISHIEALVSAGRLAGPESVDCVLEPLAAARRFCRDDLENPRRVLVYDLGGDNFDVALVEVGGGNMRLLSINGAHGLGGNRFDEILTDHLEGRLNEAGFEFYRHGDERDAVERVVVRQLLRRVVEGAKRELDWAEVCTLRVPPWAGVIDDRRRVVEYEGELSRDEFWLLIDAEVRRTIHLCRETIAKVEGNPHADRESPPMSYWRSRGAVDELLVLGGSSLIPLVSAQLSADWGSPLSLVPDPMSHIALGATL